MGRLASLSMALAVGLGSAGCEALDTERRPYTPFPVASGEASPIAAPAPLPAPIATPQVGASHEALLAPARAKEWRLAERQLQAPDGLTFRLGLVGGLSGTRDRDVLAWLVGSPEKPVIGELWLYPEQGSPRWVASAPGFLPTGPKCSHGARLTRTGPSSVTLDIKATCTGSLLPRAPERCVMVLAPLRDPPMIVGFRLAAPAPGEKIEIEITSKDRDRDARDDVEMSFLLSTPEGSNVRARFAWLDRSAGLSRDAAEPLASFAELAALETARASSQKSSLGVAEHVASARRLYASLCAESGVPRIFLDSGEPLPCGDLGRAFESLSEASINAALNLGQVGTGFSALQQHKWFPSGNPSLADRFTKRQLLQLERRVARRRVIKLVPLKARPRTMDEGPHFSPLSFHADGSLLLLTAEGIVRAAPDGRYEYEASDEVDPWPTVVVSPTGERLTGIAYPCDRSEISWLRTAADGTPLIPLPTALIAPRPGSCASGSAFEALPVAPVAWDAGEISAFLGAGLLGRVPPRPPMGSALSPNGRFSVVATDWGLLVAGGDKPALWTFDNGSLTAQLRDCVVSNNAQAAACILTGRAYVVLPDPKSG